MILPSQREINLTFDPRTLARRILDEPGLPYVWAGLDPSRRLPHDLHPNARAAREIAVAIAARLRERISSPSAR